MYDLRYDGLTIAVIDDEPVARAAIRGLLRQIGVRSVIEAADGKSGLAEVVRCRPAVILCDIHMRPVDGLAFTTSLRNFVVPAIARTPVILLTGDSQQSTVEAARERHINGYLVKPVDRMLLKQRLDRVLGLN